MESLMEKKIDQLMGQPGMVGVCVSDANGLSLSSKGSLKPEVAPLASQLLTFCSQLEPSSSVPPVVSVTSDHGKVSIPCNEDFVTVGEVINYVNDIMLKDCNRRELLICDGTIRPGVLVLVNDCDWELLGCEKAQLHNNDLVTFISTLHGG
ncbi:unnamed protein product [Haemonchus placei]|uniref:Ubiquitin-related modifier 1 homolog n=1 Tax=Haemonchus placei TaxID=6290 RepID=A0A0N4WK36_HAEPC|nr:unnamed protein product [Haemonchus placei]